MNEIYGCNPGNLLIAMGPCIKGCCYEVGEEVVEALKRETPAEDYILKRMVESMLIFLWLICSRF